jgi:pyrroloquinoline quinone biosynthesis protein D
MAAAGSFRAGKGKLMAQPENTNRPHLAPGCRWAEPNGAERMLLFPEGAIRLQGTGRAILERCDGQRTVQEIIEDLQKVYSGGDPARIKSEVATFLEQLHSKRLLDY